MFVPLLGGSVKPLDKGLYSPRSSQLREAIHPAMEAIRVLEGDCYQSSEIRNTPLIYSRRHMVVAMLIP